MLSYIEFVIALIVAVAFLKPKDIINIMSFVRDIITKIKHLIFIGKQEVNKVIDETKLQDLRKEFNVIAEQDSLYETTKTIYSAKQQLDDAVSDLYTSTNLKLDNIIINSVEKEEDNKKENSKDTEIKN